MEEEKAWSSHWYTAIMKSCEWDFSSWVLTTAHEKVAKELCLDTDSVLGKNFFIHCFSCLLNVPSEKFFLIPCFPSTHLKWVLMCVSSLGTVPVLEITFYLGLLQEFSNYHRPFEVRYIVSLTIQFSKKNSLYSKLIFFQSFPYSVKVLSLTFSILSVCISSLCFSLPSHGCYLEVIWNQRHIWEGNSFNVVFAIRLNHFH